MKKNEIKCRFVKYASAFTIEEFKECLENKQNVEIILTTDLDKLVEFESENPHEYIELIKQYSDVMTSKVREDNEQITNYMFTFNEYDDELIESIFEKIRNNLSKEDLPKDKFSATKGKITIDEFENSDLIMNLNFRIILDNKKEKKYTIEIF